MPYQVTTLVDLRRHMQIRWDSSVFWTDEEARLAINEAMRDWNLLTGRWRRTHTVVATVAQDPVVPLPGTITYGFRVTYQLQPVYPTSLLELDLMRTTWRLETTASGADVPTRPWYWAPEAINRIALWPAPFLADSILVDGISDTPILIDDGDYCDLGEELIDLIVDFAIHVAAFKEGGARWRQTLPYWTTFLQSAAEENQLLRTNQKFRKIAGLDRRRDMDPPRYGETRLDGVADQLRLGGQ